MEDIPTDILEAGGAVGVTTAEVVHKVPPDEDDDPAKVEAERQCRRRDYVTSQSDR